MKQIETIKSGKNYSAVSVGKMSEIIEHVLPMGPNVTIQGKVFAGLSLLGVQATIHNKSMVAANITKNFCFIIILSVFSYSDHK